MKQSIGLIQSEVRKENVIRTYE